MPTDSPPALGTASGARTVLWPCLYVSSALAEPLPLSGPYFLHVYSGGRGLGLDGVQGPTSSNSLSSG